LYFLCVASLLPRHGWRRAAGGQKVAGGLPPIVINRVENRENCHAEGWMPAPRGGPDDGDTP
jgi:hypothetical protein